MRSTAARRATTVAGCAVLGAAMLLVGAGPAVADPDDGRTIDGYGVGSLSPPNAAPGVLLTLFDPSDRDAFVGVEIFGSTATTYYECYEGPAIDAEMEGVREAEAEGSTKLLCGGPNLPADVFAYVTLDVEWEGFGPILRDGFSQDGCRIRSADRQAEVTGHGTLRIPALDIEARLSEGGGGSLQRTTTICPDPQR